MPPLKTEGKKSKGPGKGASETYISRWFAYDALEFLDGRNTPRKRKSTESLYRSDSENTADQTALNNVFAPPVPPNEQTPKGAKQTRREENVLSDVMGILRKTTNKLDSSLCIPDITKSFVYFIGAKMSNYSPQTRTSVEHAVFEIIMKVDRGYYESWSHQDNAYGSHQYEYVISGPRQNCVDLAGYSNRPSTSAGPPSGTNGAGPYGYTTAGNEDATEYSTNQLPLSSDAHEEKNVCRWAVFAKEWRIQTFAGEIEKSQRAKSGLYGEWGFNFPFEATDMSFVTLAKSGNPLLWRRRLCCEDAFRQLSQSLWASTSSRTTLQLLSLTF
ncbi:hypothetical protein EVAR_48504_1 [Eumeta japonica]|uniref:Uncharacterized protein n=1 Tax=Eumeta variegata TaxID=151549 RepID=A0A4C1XEI4_EUMVA|nr:hypothetical protein EVAR_48504_1 [Eumeta japonica]